MPGRNTYSERSGSVTGGCPAGTPVQTHTLIGDNLDEATTAEGLGVRLTLNLQDVQRQQDDLTNTDQTRVRDRSATWGYRVYFKENDRSPASSGVHNSLAITLSEGVVKLVAVLLSQEVTGERLTTILVDTLEDLSCSQIVSALRSQSRGSYSSLAKSLTL